MMSADHQVLYSGLPQEDWENKAKFPKILVNGPKDENNSKPGERKKKKNGLTTLLVLTFVSMVIALVVVAGFHFYNYPDQRFYIFHTLNTTEASPPNAENNNSANISSRDHFTDVPKINEKKGLGNDDETDRPVLLPSTTVSYLVTDSLRSDVKETTPSEKSKGLLDGKTDYTAEESLKISRGPSAKPSTASYSKNIGDNPLEHYLTTLKTQEHDEETSNKITDLIRKFSGKYLKSSNITSDDIEKWFENLASEPSTEVILIAAGIIFIGLSLLVISAACMITKAKGAKRRRQKISKAVSDLESNEKVILLTDEPSDDEFVRA